VILYILDGISARFRREWNHRWIIKTAFHYAWYLVYARVESHMFHVSGRFVIGNGMWKTNSRHWEQYRGSETAQWETVRTSTLIHRTKSHPMYFFSYSSLDRKGPDLSEDMLRSTTLSARVRACTTRSCLWRSVATSWASRLLLRTLSRPTRYYKSLL